ncbi:MAG: hypothetical protein Q8N03_09920 [Ignavibacteria bacterium]|nr:hypothetical protein [Ignavibacteria bacterium]
MKIVKLNPKKSLNKAFLKQRPLRSEILRIWIENEFVWFESILIGLENI